MTTSKAPYKVYVFHRSYFCGKMLAYLRYKEIPHTSIYKSLAKVGKKLMANTGLRQMPVVETPDGKWLQDTTPMIEWFEKKNPESPVLPSDRVSAFMTRLLEDYADEWLWRPAIYYRWMHKEDRYLYKNMFVKEFIGGFWGANKFTRWVGGKLVHKHQRDKFLYGDGMTEANREHVESIYLNTLDRLENIFQEQAFLLGDQPSLADFGFFGSMFWHFGNDPTSNRIMQERAPAVNEWVARLWNAKSSRFYKEESSRFVNEESSRFVNEESSRFFSGESSRTLTEEPKENSKIPECWSPLLKDICQNYLPYLEQNALEFEKGSERFDWHVEGYTYPCVHVSPYRVWCRERLQNFYKDLNEQEQLEVKMLLDQHGGSCALLSSPHIQSNWDPQGIAPLCTPGKVPFKHKLMSRFTGSNHIRSKRAWVVNQ